MTKNFVRNGRVFQFHRNHLGAGHFAAFANGIGNFAGLAKANSHFATFVADDHQRAEIKTTPALYHFRGAIDEHDLLGEFFPRLPKAGLAIFPWPATASSTGTASAATTTTTGLILLLMLARRLRLRGHRRR
jgi:hypothetical protein